MMLLLSYIGLKTLDKRKNSQVIFSKIILKIDKILIIFKYLFFYVIMIKIYIYNFKFIYTKKKKIL